ncbi:SDR family NAD(P)-dependent oxidoreductase [Mesonia aquimarina]|uniref:SDR family NAD(P)-dependent oxidoreductase n=1 Tax=Mesonia aquimarina TaxID=1504967 RepID=UPI000EF5C0D3|nr:SDR family NAD(P)-dependent oxidoreductase [Mesonia aquimarina]
MRILVTGANSMLGTHLVKDLLRQNYNVRAMVRKKNKMIVSSHAQLEIVKGDLKDKTSLVVAVKNVDAIIHNAAFTAQNEPLYEKYYQINVLGTQYLLTIAIQAKVKRFLFVSTAPTYYRNKHPKGKVQRLIEKTYYSQSKIEAENIVMKNASFLHVNSIHPTFMIGKYDSKPSSGKIIQWMYRKKIIAYPSGGKNFVSARQVSQSIIKILEKGKNKKSYLISGENLSYKHFFQLCLQVTKQQSTLIKIPSFLLSIAGWLGDIIRKLNIKTSWSTIHMKILSTKTYYQIKAQSFERVKTNSEQLPIRLEEAIKWMQKNNII